MVGDEIIFPLTASIEIYNCQTGDKIRSQPLPGALTSDVRLDQRGLLLAGTASLTGGRVSVIDPKRQFMIVRTETLVGSVLSAPTSFQGVIYAANDKGQVFAIGDQNRAVWGLDAGAFKTDRSVRADLVADEFGLYAANADGTLYVLDRNSGKIKWRYFAEHGLETAPFLTPEAVYQVVPKVGLVALDKTEGKLNRDPLWTAAGVTDVVAADKKNVYVTIDGNRLAALDRKTGQPVYDVTHAFTTFATNATDGTIFAATQAGQVMSITTNRFGTSSGSVAAK
ncbi:MAG: PQQ-binding-like beta-propeller repeat protein [Tepidisphaeraceae bacterium]